jgi:rare lipoprotein A
MRLLWIAITIFAVMLLGTAISYAQGWEYFRLHVHPTGQCGGTREVGASFYNTGKWTASGERFDHSALTAASRTPGGWAIGEHVTVRNPRTGYAITVRINDHGPFGAAWSAGVRLDLSPAAFRALGMSQSTWVCAQ